MPRTDERSMDRLSAGDRSRVERAFAALRERGIEAVFARDRAEALAWVLDRIPAGAKVAHGTSTTLLEIGFVDRMKTPGSDHRYLNPEWTKEDDPAKRALLRAKLSLEADVYLGSVQAICETGEVIGADATGSRQAFYVYGPPHVIWVAGINKLVPTLADGLRRVREVALPLEDRRVRSTGGAGSHVGKLVIYEREQAGRITLVLVGEKLGF